MQLELLIPNIATAAFYDLPLKSYTGCSEERQGCPILDPIVVFRVFYWEKVLQKFPGTHIRDQRFEHYRMRYKTKNLKSAIMLP